MAYPKNDPSRSVPASASFPELEQRILDFWSANKTFQASVEARPIPNRQCVTTC